MGFFIFDLIVLIVLILAVVQGYRKGCVYRSKHPLRCPGRTGEPGHHPRH